MRAKLLTLVGAVMAILFVIGPLTLVEGTIVCFRTDDENYGKFRVNDIRSTNGRLELQWYAWD